ncbi:magnesium transporter [Sediminispirochaeta smaragdinae]|jgi:magnesium transporter|uniref:Magnesium transporter MgtE n=1 Tax=Sediminispirochaeta smaragdinae (strain DSM 11293 / JCM 15392 / SEBR 4228) TaxID=573413 RepID=E1R390_SEDSS|nr:magnesium transporter [Sediminispirochaeta smaragdinae]ADK81276.1 magnesium transporter [Sediminispirochaeta smaragdinae DSM 11293]
MTDPIAYYREYRPMMDNQQVKELFSDFSFDQLLDVWRSLSDDEATDIFLHLSPEVKLDLITELEIEDQEKIIGKLSAQGKRSLFQAMEPDDLVDIVQSVSKEVRRTVWENLDDESKRETLFLLRFDEDDAAGLMTPRYLAVRSDINVGHALAFIRANSAKVELLSDIYVLDELQRLDGVVSVKDILSASDETKVSEIMNQRVISVLDSTDQEEVARTLETHDLVSIPVVDQENILLGVITFDDVMDVIREEQTEDVYRMGAMSGEADAYMNSSIWRLVKKRVPWLIILLLLGTVTTNVLHHYESIILGAAFLFMYMPVITQTGGNSGSQSSTLMIRGLATGEIVFRDIGKILFRELLVGLFMGGITGLVILLRSYFLPPGIDIYAAFVVGISLALVVFISNLIGTLAPLLIHRMGFDPTVMSAPLMATLIDVAGITIYFETARRLLSL